MVTLNKILSDIRDLATGGSNSTDFRIEDSQLKYWIHQTRSMLITQAINKRQDISDTWLQPITCVDLVEVDRSECCEIETECKILRTVRQIPDTIETNGDNFIVRVETNDGTIISKTTPFSNKYDRYSKYTSNKTRWYLKNNYIYIINNSDLNDINLWGIFDNPEDLISFTNCGGNTCFSINRDYPCSMKMAEQITDIVLRKKVFPFIQMPRDTTNNASDEFNEPLNPKNLK